MKPLHPVAAVAARIVETVMQAGQGKHGDTWRTRPDAEDLDHARDHLRSLEAGDRAEDHLAHALTRLAIIVARRENAEPPSPARVVFWGGPDAQ